MTLRLVVTADARAQLDDACSYIIARGSPAAADRMRERLIEAMLAACAFPGMGRRVTPTVYELTTVWPYIIRYRVKRDVLLVLRIRHGARRPS